MPTHRLAAACLLAVGLLSGCSSSQGRQLTHPPATEAYPYPTSDVPADEQLRWTYGWMRVLDCEDDPSGLPKGKTQLSLDIIDHFGQDNGDELGARLVYDGRPLQVRTSDSVGIVTAWNMRAGREIVDVVLDPATCERWALAKTHPPFELVASPP
ncbi:hypothetical protein [Streptacidiphilus sp. MAP12-33]|uniref:hypothetical protein n=1 Tax=Streptacidiphilus sp. MAP12-33 TaxID=3156266 RepID=UPI00351695D1